ncbi:MAG TPA: PQQ-binding-like beta-propeller repeat protein [Candidatus Bathyarchaeia archaeon]
MQLSPKLSKATTATIIVLLLTSIALTVMPIQALTETQVDTIAYLSFRPNPIGLGQTLLVNIWITPSTARGNVVHGYEVTFTRPDGSKYVEGPMDDYGLGDMTQWFEYVPDKVGNWTVEFSFPGQWFNTSSTHEYYKPSRSPVRQLVVQNDPVPGYEETPLPTDYWDRPIYAENREWYRIGGDWLRARYNVSGTSFNPWSTAPNSAHIMWAKSLAAGGLIGGGDYGTWGVYSTESPSGYTGIILYGLTYATLSPGTLSCIDIRTGEVVWTKTMSAPTYASSAHHFTNVGSMTGSAMGSMSFQTPTPILLAFGNNYFQKYNALTGDLILNVTGMTATAFDDPYVYSKQGSRLIKWTIDGTDTTFSRRIIWNVSYTLGGISFIGDGVGVYLMGSPSGAFDTETGDQLWNGTIERQYSFGGVTAYGKAIYPLYYTDPDDGSRGYICYDTHTGKELWRSAPGEYPWGSFWSYTASAAYGYFYVAGYDGYIYALNATTGKVAWKYFGGTSGWETPSGVNGYYAFSYGPVAVADGKLYGANCEDVPKKPFSRGWMLHCVNATSGAGIWNISFSTGMQGGPTPIADGYLLAANLYDTRLYCFGKGKSATTVEAPLTAMTLGQSVVLKGTVLDISPGKPGVPCVSAESMTAWMEYLYMQKSCPSDVKGVPVSLYAVDANNNTIHIGDATTDGLTGAFSYLWEPEITGKYTVTATFKGDDSYGSSVAGTAVGVVDAPEATPTPPPQVIPDYSVLIYVLIIAVVIAIVIGLVNLLLLRKKQ